jgi:hypothetical protein
VIVPQQHFAEQLDADAFLGAENSGLAGASGPEGQASGQ